MLKRSRTITIETTERDGGFCALAHDLGSGAFERRQSALPDLAEREAVLAILAPAPSSVAGAGRAVAA